MAVPFRKSPCCGARSRIRGVSLEQQELALRCSRCGRLRIEPLRSDGTPRAKTRSHLQLVVSNNPEGHNKS